MQVRLTQFHEHARVPCAPGTVLVLPDDAALRLIAAGRAEPVSTLFDVAPGVVPLAPPSSPRAPRVKPKGK